MSGVQNKKPTPADRYRERWPTAEPAHEAYLRAGERLARLSQTHRVDSPEVVAAREALSQANERYKAACFADEKAQKREGTYRTVEVRCQCGSHVPATFKRCPDCNRKLSVTGPP